QRRAGFQARRGYTGADGANAIRGEWVDITKGHARGHRAHVGTRLDRRTLPRLAWWLAVSCTRRVRADLRGCLFGWALAVGLSRAGGAFRVPLFRANRRDRHRLPANAGPDRS